MAAEPFIDSASPARDAELARGEPASCASGPIVTVRDDLPDRLLVADGDLRAGAGAVTIPLQLVPSLRLRSRPSAPFPGSAPTPMAATSAVAPPLWRPDLAADRASAPPCSAVIAIGLAIGLVAGVLRWVDAVLSCAPWTA
jgi:hypothetical protein